MDDWLKGLGLTPWLIEVADLVVVVVAATLVYFVVRAALVRVTRKLATNTATYWDDEIVKSGVFTRIAHIAPAFVVYYGMSLFPDIPEVLADATRRVAVAIMILVTALGLSSFLRAVEAIYDSHPRYRERPIKGYLQVASILIYLVAGLLILAALMNRSPWIFVSGIGAMTA
ncbi:MAG: hypothetical protein ABGX04_10040, partial [Myxococcales bacterium]